MTIDYKRYYEISLFGRYIHADHIKNRLEAHRRTFAIDVLGQSVLGENIHFIKIGSGKKKILIWSQMHGNESTTTKALFDLLNVFGDSNNALAASILKTCTLGIIPILNPDGARLYTRLNANAVDLNRDAQNLTQPESRLLRQCFEAFQPDYCFNLHGQRTIFSAGAVRKPATVSFLSPARDEARSVTETRKKAMHIIAKMNAQLQNQIPDQVGIYDDAFNINCVGDTFQSFNVPTVLFEAGHHAGDYQREKVRYLIFQSLWVGVHTIAFDAMSVLNDSDYWAIPKNEKLFYDIIIRNAKLKKGNSYQIADIAVLYQEVLKDNRIDFCPKIEKISDLRLFYGHKEIEAKGHMVFKDVNGALNEGDAIDFVFINNTKHSLLL